MKTNQFLRIVESFVEEGADGCWEWPGVRRADGYANVCHWKGQEKHGAWLAHRLSFHLLVRPIADDELVCHSCDNRACIRPDHLWPGSTADNAHDRDRKGRGIGQRPTCGNGHRYDEVGFTLAAKGRGGVVCRVCKQCSREAQERYRERQRAKRRAA